MTVARGDRLGDWVVEKPLGEGGMGSVYRCHSVLAEDVHAAVKVLKRGEAIESKERFVQELRTLSALNHPAIVRVLGGGRDEQRGIVYMAMELVDGKDLSDRLATGPLTGDEAVRIFGPVADALAYAHQRGVAHRDIKPSNIMLRADGTPVIVDFGIAVAEGRTRVTKEGLVPGTVVYLPPEIFEGTPPDPKSTDAYALGVVMWEAVTGRSPFAHDPSSGEASVLAQVMGQKLRSEVLDPGKAVPEHLREAIRRTTDPSPDTRLVDLGAVRDLLTTGYTAVPRKARRRSGCAMAAVALVTLAVGTTLITTLTATVAIGAWWMGSQGQAPVRPTVDLAATLEEAASALERGDFASARRSAGLAIDDHAEDPHANLMYGQALLADGDGLLARPYLCAAVDGGLGSRVPGHTSGDLDCERGPGAATPLVDPLALAHVDLSAKMAETRARADASDEPMAIADLLGEPSGGGGRGEGGSLGASGGGGSGAGSGTGSGSGVRRDPPPPPTRATSTPPPAASAPMAPPPPAAAPMAAPSPSPAPMVMGGAPPPTEAEPPAASANEAPPADQAPDADDAKAEKRDAETVSALSYDGRVVEGPLEWSQARTALSRIKTQFDRCGEREPDGSGRVRLRIAIGAGGAVASVTVVENSTGSADLATCFVAAAQRASFPAADAPSIIEIDLTL